MSTPAARKPATPHSTAFAICGVPVTRPPTSSVSRRKFSAIGESPSTCGRIFAAASAQDESSVAEHAAAPCGGCNLLSGSFFWGASCARQEIGKTANRRQKRFHIVEFLSENKRH